MLLQQVLSNLMSPDVLLALAVGVCGGMVVGVLPGLSGSMAIALLLPVTFSMRPEAGLIMLMAIYTSALTGGSISAVLLHTPGTPSNAATAIDGYALTKEGRGLEAVGLSMLSSVFGGVASAIALMVIAPPLARVSLMFSEPEYFLVALFGLTIIGSLSGGSMLKGLLMGLLGLFLATIGIDAVSGSLRFTFGEDRLMSGIQIVPAMIGLFSISQVLLQCENYKNANQSILEQNESMLSGKFLPSLKEFFHYLPIMVLSSVIGIIVGILPGAGGNIGSWVSYNEAKRFSKHKELFGKGSLEGLCACETGNNAVTGGSFIPLLTLSIPGSPAAAIILGGLLVHGLVPGNRLFTEQATITYTILAGFLIANLAMGAFGLFLAKYAVNVTRMPLSVLSPVIVVLSLIGSYALNSSMFDVWVAIAFGILGYVMQKFDFPSAPLVLAMVLGGTAEGGLMRSFVMARGNIWAYYFSRPVCVFLIIIIVLSIFAPFFASVLRARFARAYKD